MKRHTPIILLSVLSAFTAITAVAGSIAWFSNHAIINDDNTPIKGLTEGAYFAYGNGTPSKPYGITKPRHLYNLSWLQYLNFFNKNVDGTGKIIPTYFELGGDVAGEGMVIPPIGDEDHPFVGMFNGNGYVISDFVISNDPTDITVKPAAVSSYSPSEIVGLFGVVGSLESDTTTSYNTATNQIYDTGILNLKVVSNTPNALAGIVAGYANGTISQVAVAESSIEFKQSSNAIENIGTEKLSDYTIIGYCTTNYKSSVKKINQTIYDVNTVNVNPFVIQSEGTDVGWGGSVNMYDMYTHLDDIWRKFNKRGRTNVSGDVEGIQYYANREITEEKNGTVTVNSETNPTVNRVPYAEYGTFSSSGDNYHAYYNYEYKNSSNQQTASYGFIIEETTSNEENFMCLTGNKTVTIQNAQSLKTNYFDEYNGQQIYITISGTNYYLQVNGTTGVTCTSDGTAASYWMIDGNTIWTTINDVKYYLNVTNGTTISLSTTSNTTWYYDSSLVSYYVTYNTTNYYLSCTTTNWVMQTVNYYYLIYDNNSHYVRTTNNRSYPLTYGTRDQAIHWLYDTSLSAYYYNGYNSSGADTKRYFTYNSSASPSVIANANQDGGYFRINGSTSLTGTNVYMKSASSNVYIRFNNNQWTTSNNTNNATRMNVEGVLDTSASPYAFQNIATSTTTGKLYIKQSKTETVDATVEVNHTYFPLRQDSNNPGVPLDTNTGYVVSGANYWDDPYGDIRVSRYSKSSYLSGGVNTVYTVNSSRASVQLTNSNLSSFNFQKYDKAKESMASILSQDSTYVYGLHFMNANISYGGSKPVIAESAVINGSTYSNYEFPTDCVDFNLKEKGFINFFAGSYYTGNNCFFSLHEVVRSGNSVSDIKTISEVYSDASDTAGLKSYQYKYSDGTFSVPYKYVDGVKTKLDGSTYVEHQTQGSAASGYSSVFNTNRITNPNSLTNNVAYYFEIPMNEGEYCLGSVSGKNGAYLMYLDIAANASKIQRTTVYEHFIRQEDIFNYPLGVSFLAKTGIASALSGSTVNPLTSGFISIDASQSGSVLVVRNSNTDIEAKAKEGGTLLSDIECSYKDDSVTVHKTGQATNLGLDPSESDSYDIKRMQYLDYDAVNDKMTRTIITDTSKNSGAYTRDIKQYDGAEEVAQASIVIYDNDGNKITNTGVNGPITIGAAKTTVVVTYHYVLENGTTSTETINLNVSRANGAYYYTINGYIITITVTNGTVTITVTERGTEGYTVTINGTTASDGATIVASAA